MSKSAGGSSFSIDRRDLLKSGAWLGAGALLAAQSPAVIGAAEATEDPGLIPIPIPEQAPAKEGVAKLSDVGLWYWDTGGKGTPIVLFHPFTGSGHVWSYQQPVFVKAGYRVIGYSRRGFRGSESGSKDKPGTGSGDLHELLNVLGINKFHAVASAGGAFVAADYAISHPERLQSLVLACSILGAQGGEFTKMSSSLRVEGFNALPEYFRELSPSYRAADPEGTQRWRELQEAAANPGERIMQPNANKITLDKLEAFEMPTLLIAGGADLIAPPPLLRLFAKHIPKSELAVLPECGHSAYWERPALFNETVLKFLRKHRA